MPRLEKSGDQAQTREMSDDPVTPEQLFKNRRIFLQTSIFAGTTLATAGVYRYFRNSSPAAEETPVPRIKTTDGDESTSYQSITHYNNYYEFSTDKEGVADKAKNFVTSPWNVQVEGLVEKPREFSFADLEKFKSEERIYRFRCVEGWSMVIPWLGFPLKRLLEEVAPLSEAKYVAFETYFDPSQMPEARLAGIKFPYVEGLRLDEAMNPLTLLATGIYGKPLAPQNGAPVRLVVPWKYGFKSIKSIVRIRLVADEPPTTWNIANPSEYGFYSNVNPTVDHPRWSQARERRIGETGTRPTQMFNGYGDQVSQLYTGMDLAKYF